MRRNLRKSNHNVVVLRLLQFHWKMYFQPLCSKISVQMVPVNFYTKGKCLLFFSTAAVLSQNPLHFPLVTTHTQYWLYLSLERRHDKKYIYIRNYNDIWPLLLS